MVKWSEPFNIFKITKKKPQRKRKNKDFKCQNIKCGKGRVKDNYLKKNLQNIIQDVAFYTKTK